MFSPGYVKGNCIIYVNRFEIFLTIMKTPLFMKHLNLPSQIENVIDYNIFEIELPIEVDPLF